MEQHGTCNTVITQWGKLSRPTRFMAMYGQRLASVDDVHRVLNQYGKVMHYWWLFNSSTPASYRSYILDKGID